MANGFRERLQTRTINYQKCRHNICGGVFVYVHINPYLNICEIDLKYFRVSLVVDY